MTITLTDGEHQRNVSDSFLQSVRVNIPPLKNVECIEVFNSFDTATLLSLSISVNHPLLTGNEE